MKLEEFLQIKELISKHKFNHKKDREFGLKYKDMLLDSARIMRVWQYENIHNLKSGKLIEKFTHLLRVSDFFIAILAFILGLGAGVGLLSYSGKELVNIIYFLIFAFFLPLASGILTIFSIMKANSQSQHQLLQTIPISWLQKKVYKFLGEDADLNKIKLPPKILNLKLIETSLYFSLSFYTALTLSLIIVVISEDVAFGWRSTLHFTSEEFFRYMSIIATPWKLFIPSAVPSLELIEQSHYFRLGGDISQNLIDKASLLGEWWRFLFMNSLVYGVLFRVALLIIVKLKLKKEIEKATVESKSVRKLLSNMRTRFITTQTTIKETPLVYEQSSKNDSKKIHNIKTNLEKEIETEKSSSLIENSNLSESDNIKELDNLDDKGSINIEEKKNIKLPDVIGWSFNIDEVRFFCDTFNISYQKIYQAGGNNSIDDDLKVIDEVGDEVIIFIKSWEPPMMDFIDFIEELEEKNIDILIYPLGLEANKYMVKESDISIWQDKLNSLNIQLKIKK